MALALSQTRQETSTLQRSRRISSQRTIKVKKGASLQAAIDAAKPGDTILVEAGASFIGPFTLPNKGSSSEWITIQTSAADLPPPGVRITPAHSAVLPKLLSAGGGQPALQTAPGAHHYRLVGLELRTINATSQVYDLVLLGSGDAQQNSLDKVPHHLILDRCLITAFPTQSLKRGVALHSGETTVQGCYIAGFKSSEQDAQAIAGWNGPGPFQIINNYLEATGENLVFGGSVPSIAGLVPSDIEIRGNYFYKPLSWRRGDPGFAGVRWSVKNVFELKSARRVVFEGNVIENCWGDVNAGYGTINLTVRGDSGPQATIEDVVIKNNIVRHAANGFNILGKDTSQPSRQGQGVKIVNNLLVDIDGKRWGGDGEFIKISNMQNVTVDHNTVLHSGSIISVYGAANHGFVYTNNIARHNAYGIIGQDVGSGKTAINIYFPSAVIRRNVIAGASEEYPNYYPGNNFYPGSLNQLMFSNPSAGDYSLAAGAPYKRKATDGTDVGCDIEALKAATAGVARR